MREAGRALCEYCELRCIFLPNVAYLTAIAHVVFRFQFECGTPGWHAFIAGLYGLAAINLMANPLLGVLLLALVVGLVLIAEEIIELVLFFMLSKYRHAM